MSIGKYSVVKLKELQLGDVATDLTFSQNVSSAQCIGMCD